MAYDGVELKDAWGRPLGLTVKNGKIINEPDFDIEAIRAKINGWQVKQPWTIAKEKAREEAEAKKLDEYSMMEKHLREIAEKEAGLYIDGNKMNVQQGLAQSKVP